MSIREIRLNKDQFKIFNDDDQFQLFCDDEGMPVYENLNNEIEKLFEKYDYVMVTENDRVYCEKNGKREILHPEAYESYVIALEVKQDFK